MIEAYYVYPTWHTVSFSLIAKKHIEYMQRVRSDVKVYEVDELVFPTLTPLQRLLVFIHPMFYIMHKVLQFRTRHYDWWRNHFGKFVGIDVCDSDHISEYAVKIANLMDAVVVPSNFCREVYQRSGVRVPIHVVQHGVDPEWYEAENVWETGPVKSIHPTILQLYLHKIKNNVKYILFWLWHSPDRKGWPEVRELYAKLKQHRRDVVLVLKTAHPRANEFMEVAHLGAIEIYGWLDDYSKMALYDLADITLMFSRGGSFEVNCLESLARGVPCVASSFGPWTEYVPEFLQVKTKYRVQPLPGNAFHDGYGYTVDVDDALSKVLDILNNYDDYKARTAEWREKVLRDRYRWDVVAKHLINLLE